MSNEVWLCVCVLVAVCAHICTSLWRDKEDKRKDEELKRTRDSANRWESRAKDAERRLFEKENSKWLGTVLLKEECKRLEDENGSLKKKYADELQKRLELAELVKKYERGKEAVDEAIEHVKSEVARGEVSSGD